MIRWLTDEEWKDFIENQAFIGTYVSHELVNKGNITHPIDEYHFSDAIIKVKVIEPGYKRPKSIYFNNTGIIKVQGDNYDEYSENAEYTFYWLHPHLVNENFEFASMMIKKFGLEYIKRRATHCNNELYECITDKDLHKNDADEALMMLDKIRTNISSVISPEVYNLGLKKQNITQSKSLSTMDKNLETRQRINRLFPNLITKAKEPKKCQIDELIDQQLIDIVKEKAEELEYASDYIYLQESILFFMTQEYYNLHHKHENNENQEERS